MDAHKSAEIIDEAISLAGCVGGSYFCHYLLINQKLIDPTHIRLATIGRVPGVNYISPSTTMSFPH